MAKNGKKNAIVLIILGMVLFVLCLLSLRLGSAKMSEGDFFSALTDFGGKTPFGIILYSLRFPRMLAGIVAGVGLGMSGAVLQIVTGNRMASPNLVGVNSGAGFAVVLVLSFFPNLFHLVPLFAFAGALVATLVICAISRKIGMTKGTVILVGLAVSAVLTSGISLFSMLDSDVLVSYNAFSVGSLSFVRADELLFPAFTVLLVLLLTVVFSAKIDILSLGDVTAHSLGISVAKTRFFALALASASASAAVSFAGLLGFVGLMSPHIARRLVSCKASVLVPASALVGAIITVLADILGRTLFAPSEIPVGILLSLVGAPFFLFLLFTKEGRDNA